MLLLTCGAIYIADLIVGHMGDPGERGVQRFYLTTTGPEGASSRWGGVTIESADIAVSPVPVGFFGQATTLAVKIKILARPARPKDKWKLSDNLLIVVPEGAMGFGQVEIITETTSEVTGDELLDEIGRAHV